MAASLKVSELSALSSVAAADLLLIADSSATASKKVTLTNLEGSISLANLGTRAISDLSNVASTAPSSGQVLAYNGSAWAPAANTTKADLDVDHLITLSGVSAAADDLGTFSGSTIADSATVKTALQSLETAVESASSAAATVSTTTRSTDATHFLTFVDSDNSSSAEESVYTDAGISYNPSSNLLTVGEVSATTLDIGGTNVTSTAAELNILDGVTSTAAELNILDGVTSTTAELNILDGVTSTAAELNILDGVTSTATELNLLDGVTATTAELNYVDGVTSNVQTQLDAKQATVTAGDGLAFSGATLAVDLSSEVVANETLTLSGMSDSNHDGTYSMVYRSGTRLLATADQSGANVVISIEREAEFSLAVSGTSVSAIDNGGSLTVQKYTGYLTNSGDVWTWASGSDASDFHWYYWDTTDDILVAWDGTNDEWKAFDLGEATGNVASFISDLDSTGSQAGYVAPGENFTLTSGNIASLTSNNDTYPGTLIIKVPDAADSNITYGSASSHPYYVYQSSDAKKWILFATESSYYWTAWYRSTAFDLTTETLTDDATAFTLDNVGHFEFITTASDTYNSNNIPDADASEVTYATAASGAYLEIASNKLQAKVKDEDDMSSDSQDHVPTQQSVKAYVDANEVHIDNLASLTGVAKDAVNLGTFTGTTVSDSRTVKQAIQEIETELESVAGGGAQAASLTTVTRATDATHYLTFVQDDNGSATQETFHTDAGVVYNPSSNLLTVGALTISGDLTVQGTTTNISSTTITVDDKNIELGAVDTPSDTTADGGGITLKGATDKTINWINSTDNWTSSESFDLVSGKEYKIANASVLSATTLGSAVVASSLTSVGTLTALTVSGTTNLTGTFQLGSTSVTATAAELNILDGVTATATELNALDGITSTTAELNILDGVTATAAELNILDGVTSTSAELNILDGVTSTAAELNILDGVTSFLDEDNMASDSATSIPSQQSVKAYVDANETHIDNLVTLSGVAKDATNLGTFTGTTISDSVTVKTALQSLETALEGSLPVLIEAYNDSGGTLTKGQAVYISGTHSSGKPEVSLADSDGSGTFPAIGLIESTVNDGEDATVLISGVLDGLNTNSFTVGDALYLDTTAGGLTTTRPTSSTVQVQKVGVVTKSDSSTGSILVIGAGRVNDVPNEITALTGVALDAVNLGAFSGSTISDNVTIKAALQALETAVEAAEESSVITEIDGNVNDLITLSGVAENTTNLGTFTGSIIADNETVKGAIQDLEDQAGNITLTNIDIDGATGGTIATTSLFIIDEGANGSNKKATGAALATFVAAQKSVKDLKANSTSADSEPSGYYFLVVDSSDGSVHAINKEFVETEGSP